MIPVLRSLPGVGFDVTALGTSRTAPGLWSRLPAARRLAPDPRQDLTGFIDKLETVVRERRPDLLLAATDASLFAVSSHRDRLPPDVRLGLPSHELVQRALDKRSLVEEAASAGLDVPDTRVCRGAAEAVAAAEQFGYPVVVKPTHTVVTVDGVLRRWGSVLARDAGAVARATERFGASLVQRRVDGRVLSFGAMRSEHDLLGFVVSRYVRTWPPQAGNVCFSETIDAPPGLVDKVHELMRRIGWVGLCELELIESHDGGLAAIDFNPRVYGSLGLAVSAGVPLPELWCQWALDENPRIARRARIGARYRWEDADASHLSWQLRHGHVRAAAAVARPRRDVTHAYFEISDPAPALARAIQVVRTQRQRGKLK